MKIKAFVWVLCLGTAIACHIAGRQAAAEDHNGTPKAKIQVEHNAESFSTTVRIRATGGRVAWSDILLGLARARGFDDMALAGVMPQDDFAVDGLPAQAILAGLNMALEPHIRFHTEYPGNAAEEPRLVVTLDRAATLASQRRFTRKLRQMLQDTLGTDSASQYGLRLDDRWHQAAKDKRLVVFVHGLDGGPHQGDRLLAPAREAGLPCGSFRYPNDQPITDSAKLLSRELATLAKTHPERGVSLLTHSMGGLVARAVIEDPKLNPGNVRQLIMIAPPNHGSLLAHFGFGMDVWEQMIDSAGRRDARLLYAWIEDGLSEAAVDLIPGSRLLQGLNARGRNPAVQYTIFLGTEAPLDAADLARLRNHVTEAGKRSRWVRFFGVRAHEWLADLDEVVDGKGDGAVAVKRGRLAGVDDISVLRFGHIGVLDGPGQGDLKKVYRAVLERLLRETDNGNVPRTQKEL